MPIWRTYLARMRASRVLRFVGLWFLAFCILESFLFNEILKTYNYLEIFPADLLFPTVMHGMTALVVALIVYFVPWFSTLGIKAVCVAFLSFVMVNFDDRLTGIAGTLRTFLPALPPPGEDMAILTLVLMGIFVAIAVGISRLLRYCAQKYPQATSYNMVLSVGVLVLFLSVGQGLRMISVFSPTAREAAVEAPEITPPKQRDNVEKPDIYYIVLDRYTNKDILAEQYEYDNQPFLESLRAKGFTVNDSAYANYPFTDMSIASTLNADYTDNLSKPFKNEKIQSHTLYQNMVRNASVIKALKKEGYTYHQVGNWYGTSSKAPLADFEHIAERTIKLFGTEKHLRGIESSQFIKSPYYQLSKAGLSWFSVAEVMDATQIKQQFAVLSSLAKQPEQGGRFIFGHILLTHPPYFFNADGSLATEIANDDEGLLAKDKYLNQVDYANAQISKLIEQIQQQSEGRAVIILNSDEGPYPEEMGDDTAAQLMHTDMRRWDADWIHKKFGILQAVYMPQATTEDLQHLSSVNIFRIVFARYFNYDMPYLPECHYALTKGRSQEYQQYDATRTIRGENNAACPRP